MKKLFVALTMLLVFCALPAFAQLFPQRADVSIVKLKPMTFHGKKISIYGIVSNAQMRENIDPLDAYRWEFDLTDASKETIHVLAKKSAPPNGSIKKIVGVIDASQPAPILTLVVSPNLWLIIALVMLIILAVVLVVQLTRNSERGGDPPPPPPPPLTCSSCGTPIDATAAFCEACGQPVGAGGTISTGDQRRDNRTHIFRPPLANLTVVAGIGAPHGTQYALSKEQKLKIGRDQGTDIPVDDEYASKEHAVIWWQDGSFYVQDEASSNGTLVNGQRITRQALQDNDSIQIGNTKFVFKAIAMANEPAVL